MRGFITRNLLGPVPSVDCVYQTSCGTCVTEGRFGTSISRRRPRIWRGSYGRVSFVCSFFYEGGVMVECSRHFHASYNFV